MNETKTYTANDIERYHKGEMSAAEMHLLEKAALDDPSLADMLEGYAYATTPAADLASLQQKLQQRIEKENRKRTILFPVQWLKVAAIFVLLAGAGWLFFGQKTTEKIETAKNDATEVAKEKLEQAGIKTDSTAVGQSTIAALPADSSHTTVAAVAINDKKSKEERKRDETYKTALADKAGSEAAPQPTVDSTSTAGLVNGPGRNNASPPGNAAMTRKALAQPSAIYDKTEKGIAGYVQTTKKADSTQELLAMQNKSAAKPKAVPDTIVMNVVMQPDQKSLSEVVVTASPKLRSKLAGVRTDSLEPETGWDSFDDYIAKNAKTPAELTQKPTDEREVELRFRTDSEGNPIKIKVTKSLCKKCDAEAIRLLKEGPKWKGKKGKVKIKFPLSP